MLQTQEFQQIGFSEPLLEANQVQNILSQFPKKPVSFFQNYVIAIENIPKYSTFMDCLTSPSIIVSMLSEECTFNSQPHDKGPYQSTLKRIEYQQNPMPQYQAVYKLSEICQKISKGQLILHLAESDKEEVLKTISGVDWQYNKEKKTYVYKKSNDKLTLIIKYPDKTREDLVVIEKCDAGMLNLLQLVRPDSFIETCNTILPNQILRKEKYPRRMLVSADYGSGKSSLLQFLYQHSTSYDQNNYEWVIPMKLSKIIRKLKNSSHLIDIIEYQAQKYGLISADGKLLIWQKAILIKAIEKGQLLLLIDAVDEVVKSTDFEKAKDWLGKLDGNISFIIATRPHAEIQLKGLLQEKISLNLFEWDNVKKYIQNYFDNIYSNLKNKNETKDLRHLEFSQHILDWLDNYLQSAIDILKRPLHTALLCQSLERFYLDYIDASKENLEQILSKAPWHDKVLYRTKLYYLIIKEQLRRYLIYSVEVKNIDFLNEEWRSSLLTQPLEIRLREISFKRIFACQPIKILHIFNEEKLDNELDLLGFITHHGETEYRIFVEYYAAEYLLFCLSRDSNDAMYKHAQEIIESEHSNKSYEEVWRILGEMMRYGNASLNFKEIGIKSNIFEVMSDKFHNDDIVKAYWCFFRSCLNGDAYDVKSDLVNLKSPKWFSSELVKKEINDEVQNAKLYAGKNLDQLLIMAKESKSMALDIIDYLIANNMLTEEWLLKLYSEKPAKLEIQRMVSTLKALAEKNGWPSSAWGGYWDIDVYFPALYRMRKKLFLVPAAYFMHRIDSRNGLFSYGITGCIDSTFNALIHNEFEDEKSLAIFLMMLQTWLRQRNILRIQSPLAIVIHGLNMAWACFNKPNYKWVGIDTLFAIAFTFRLPVTLLNSEEGNFLLFKIPYLKNSSPVKFKFETDQSMTILINRFKQLSNQCDYSNMILSDIVWKNPIADDLKQSATNVESAASLIPKFNSPVHTSVQIQKPKKDEKSDENASKHKSVKKL